MRERILIHLPAYREPELRNTIKSALENAKYPERLIFGICLQYHPDDGFDDISDYEKDPRFKVHKMLYSEAKGLPYARAIINEKLLTDEEFVLQLDSHHRFTKNWDEVLLGWYYDLKKEGYNPLIGGYLPMYDPFNDPEGRVQEPWLSEAACFYPHGTIFIRPTYFPNWESYDKPVPARFLSGHFSFGPNKWAKEIRHDPEIYFSGEEINLTVRSFTHGYDLFHPHRVIIWHATMREERSGKLVWDDQSKAGNDMWWRQQNIGRSRIRQMLGTEDNGHDLTGYDIGSKRSISDYEKYAGVEFKTRSVHPTTVNLDFPTTERSENWRSELKKSIYNLVTIRRADFPGDYQSILVAYDDADGNGIYSYTLEGERLQELYDKDMIHYEDFFLLDSFPEKVVYWAHDGRNWKERKEEKIY